MKKTLLALTVAAVAATSANAAVVYSQEGTEVQLGGSLRLALGNFGKDQRTDLRNDGSRLILDVKHALNSDVDVIGNLQLRFDGGAKDDGFGNPTTKYVYGGFANKDIGTVTLGLQTTNLDDVQLSDFAYKFGGNNDFLNDDVRSIKFKSAEFNGFSFGVDYVFGEANKVRGKTEKVVEVVGNGVGVVDKPLAGGLKNGYAASAFYTAELAQDAKLNLAAGYGVARYDNNMTTSAVKKETGWRLAAQTEFGPGAFGVEFGRKVTKVNDKKVETLDNLLVGASYQVIEPSKVYLQYQHNVTKVPTPANVKTKENVYIIGADYEFNKNVVAFVEYARADEKVGNADKTKENAYVTGLRISF